MKASIFFEPSFPEPHLFAIWLALIAFAVIAYLRINVFVGRFRQLLLAFLRIGVITALVVVLLRPMVLDSAEIPDSNPVFLVLLDASGSMATRDVGRQSRFESVLPGIEKLARSFDRDLQRHYDLKFYLFSETAMLKSPEEIRRTGDPIGKRTELGESLLQAANSFPDRRKAGMLLISDGRENGDGDAAAAAMLLRSMQIPVWSTAVGSEAETKDVHVTARLNQSFLFSGQQGSLKVDLNQTGYDDWYANVVVSREGEMVGTQQVMLKRGIERVSIPITEEESGTYEYEVRVEGLEGETDRSNNTRAVFVRVIDDRASVLLVEGQPYWESKFLLRTLQADPNLEVTALFQINEDKTFAVTQSASEDESEGGNPSPIRIPRTKQEFYRYDCVILGRSVDALYSAHEMPLLKSYLEERGGSIVFARGKSYQFRNEILSQIEPVIWSGGALARARFELTPAGAVNPMFDFGPTSRAGVVLRELPEMISVAKVEKEKSLAVILAKTQDQQTAEEIATISYQRYGKGKVMSVGSAGIWKWAFMPERMSQYDEIYARFWAQMIRWLVYGSDFLPGQDVSFKADKLTYDLGDAVSLVAQTKFMDEKDYDPQIVVKGPEGQQWTLHPEKGSEDSSYFAAAFLPQFEGQYEATLSNNIGQPEELTVRFTVYPGSIENRYVSVNRELLRGVSESTGGEPLSIEDWENLPEFVQEYELERREAIDPKDAWDQLWVFFTVMGVLGLEWFVRRQSGLM